MATNIMANLMAENADGAYDSIDAQKAEFRGYLESTGVVQKLTRVLIQLFEDPDRPVDAIDYIKRNLGAPAGVDVERLAIENDELRIQNAELQKQLDESVDALEKLKKEIDESQ